MNANRRAVLTLLKFCDLAVVSLAFVSRHGPAANPAAAGTGGGACSRCASRSSTCSACSPISASGTSRCAAAGSTARIACRPRRARCATRHRVGGRDSAAGRVHALQQPSTFLAPQVSAASSPPAPSSGSSLERRMLRVIGRRAAADGPQPAQRRGHRHRRHDARAHGAPGAPQRLSGTASSASSTAAAAAPRAPKRAPRSSWSARWSTTARSTRCSWRCRSTPRRR